MNSLPPSVETDHLTHEPPGSPPRSRSYRQVLRHLGTVVSIAALAGFVYLVNHRFDYVAILPGNADVVNERLKISGTKVYPPEGKVMWATVGLKRGLGVFELLDGWLSSDTDVFPRKEILGDETNKQSEQRSKAEMDDAKLVARVTVARRLGFKTANGGAEVAEIDERAPAYKLLKPTDLIVSADGKPVCLQAIWARS